MAEVVRELTGDPSCVLASLAERLTRDGWRVTTRSGPLLQAARDGAFLSLTVLGSARGTRVHAEGSLKAIAYVRQAMGPGTTPPKAFSPVVARPHFGAAVTAALGLTVVASLFLVGTFCRSPSSSSVRSTTVTDSVAPVDSVRQMFGESSWPAVLPSATPTAPRATPVLARPASARPRPQPTPSPVAPSVTPQPAVPAAAETLPEFTATPVASPAMLTATPAEPQPSSAPPTPTPTLDLSGLGDAYRRR